MSTDSRGATDAVPWLRVDDGYDTHPKLLGLTEVARWRWFRVMLYAARYRTNGRLTREAIAEVGFDRYLARALEVGLLIESDEDGVYVVHDWQLYNGGSLDERVAVYLRDHPEASANETALAVPGSRTAVLAAVRRVRETGAPNGAGGGSASGS